MLFVVALMAIGYYFFVKPSEFEVNLKAKTIPGDLIGTIRIWNRSLDSARIVQVDSFNSLKQTIILGDRNYKYDWNFVTVNDSLTEVNIQITQPGRMLLNKLLIPFTNQDIEKDAKDIVSGFYEILKEHLRITRVELIGEVELDSSFCVCRSLETSQIEKANGMMKDYPLLTSFIANFNLKTAGPPIVKIGTWRHNLGELKFDFCFPIIEQDSLPVIDSLFYRKFKKKKVLKAEYYGNYITSDRAWYALLYYAEKNGYKVDSFPIEYFHNNPNLGMRESEWKAEVFLPLKDEHNE